MKRLIIILIIIAVISIPAYLIFTTQNSQDDFYAQLNEFNSLLREKNYEQAKIIYDEASSTLKANYNISLDAHAGDLVEEVKKQETTNDSLDLLYSYNEIGFVSSKVNDAIIYYEDLLRSNYIFTQGVELYNNNQFEEAMDFFHDVLEYDENYQIAQQYLNSYHQYNLAWDNAADNNLYGRNPLPSAISYNDGNIYIPYRFSNSNAILKINTNSYSVMSFPIVSTKSGAKISNLNIVGDYMFFLLEQNVSMQRSSTQNAVYRMTLEGGELTKVKDCDYTYLITYGDEFFALSETKGIVKADNYFTNEEVLVEMKDQIIEMQMVDEGIYYTVKEEENINVVYFYDGENSEEVKREENESNLHYYNYGSENITYYDLDGFAEYAYMQDTSTGAKNKYGFYLGDIYDYYGKLNESTIFTYSGVYQQECIFVSDVEKGYSTYAAQKNEISYVPVGICYELGYVVLHSDEGISFTTENMRIQQTVKLPHINNTVLSENEEVVSEINKHDFFTEQAEVFSEEQRWIYSDENVNISTERYYYDGVESAVYITHVYTQDNKWLNSTVIDNSTAPIEAEESIIWAVPAQSYNEETELIDEEKNVLTKDVYVYNDDGMFISYRANNFVSSDKIMSNNVVYIFSEGEIILENYGITKDCLNAPDDFKGRSAVGMVEPGHYVFITAEQKGGTNRGVSLYYLAKLFEEQGCISAFCFDSDYLFNIFDGEYIYESAADAEDIRKQNEILYYTVD